jgi:hypothetical protein
LINTLEKATGTIPTITYATVQPASIEGR